VTVPPMDGALRPNRALEEAMAVVGIPAPDNIVVNHRTILFSSGNRVMRLDPSTFRAEVAHDFDAEVTALSLSSGGALAIGLGDGRITIIGGPRDGWTQDHLGGRPIVCTTDLCFLSETALVVAQGSASRSIGEWKRDLMLRGATGSVWRIDLHDRSATTLADELGWPYGVAPIEGGLLVSESWKHRLIKIGFEGRVRTVLDDLPGYPARISRDSTGHYWLAVFAPRNQIVEFIQREPAFLQRMMEEIDPQYWVTPTMRPPATFLEPLQGGAQKHFGVVNPWAPTRSYGLVLNLDSQFRPLTSFHSRADGTRHGVTSCIEHGGRLLAASKGGDLIVSIDLDKNARSFTSTEATHAPAD
jgi:hypothetical protein